MRSLFARLAAAFRAEPPPAPAPLVTPRPSGLDAFAFRSPLGLSQMKPALEAATPWRWWDGDSAYFDYLGARIGPDARMLRLYPEDAGFVLHVRKGPLDDDLRRVIIDRLLPALQATEVKPAEGFD